MGSVKNKIKFGILSTRFMVNAKGIVAWEHFVKFQVIYCHEKKKQVFYQNFLFKDMKTLQQNQHNFEGFNKKKNRTVVLM